MPEPVRAWFLETRCTGQGPPASVEPLGLPVVRREEGQPLERPRGCSARPSVEVASASFPGPASTQGLQGV